MEYSKDLLFNESISIKQKNKGYRFSVDPIILAGIIHVPEDAKVADFGTGCGIIPIVLCKRFHKINVVGVEIQKDLAHIATQNIKDNGFRDRVKIENIDINEISQRGVYDFIVSNPPYIRQGSGRLNPVEEVLIARHEIKITITNFLSVASKALKNKGRIAIIFPANRLSELINEFKNSNIAPKNLTIIYSKPGKNAELVLLEGVKNGGDELKIYRPFYINNEKGEYSDAMQRIFDI
ncbi:MAG: methyltransferase [Desulfobacterales bacterium]|nr:methyltransferase [Desulfobacterales bacterium]